MIDKDAKYEDVLAELEALVVKMEDPAGDISAMTEDIKKAMEMIAWCRDKIRGQQKELEALLEKV